MNKILIAYFSHRGENWSNGGLKELKVGNTKVVAHKIAALTGADEFRIETVKDYPYGYNDTCNVAKEELHKNARPAIKGGVKNMEQYDTLILGFPNWWGTLPMAVCTFLDEYDLAGKRIVPFCTNKGSGLGRSMNDLRRLYPAATLLQGTSITGSDAVHADKEAAEIANIANK